MNNSNKTLLQILVEELPKRGGWQEGALNATQDKDGEVCFSAGAVPEFGLAAWEGGDWFGNEFYTIRASDYSTAIVTRDQYEAALAASKAVVGHNGWIDWHGGDCPVDSDAIVEVKYRKPNQYQFNNDRAGDFNWSHDGFDGDIIAYRLQKPTKSEQACDDAAEADDEADLNDCIGQPQEDIKTIRAEMLSVLNDTRLTINLRVAMKLVDAFIDAGYRKQ